MQDLYSKCLIFIKTHRRILMATVPLLVLSFIILIYNASLQNPQTTNQPSQTQPTNTPDEINENAVWHEGNEGVEGGEDIFEEKYEDWLGFEKKETLPDGTIKYTFTTDNPARPSIVITTSDDARLFERRVATADFPLPTLSEIKDTYGEPNKKIQGSRFYGAQTVTYIYDNLAFIANTQTDQVYEYHSFRPMIVDEYIKKYGEDLSSVK